MISARSVRTSLRRWLPPALEPLARSLFADFKFEGDYASWTAAEAEWEGYAADVILERVRSAALMVKRGEAAYERDSVVFLERDYVWRLLGGLLWVAGQGVSSGGGPSEGSSSLHVLDFGGSLGSTYYQHRPMLQHIADLRWSVVEQAAFVECGQRELADETLQFFASIDGALAGRGRPDVVLLSCVVQYLERPYEFIESLKQYGFEYLIVDRAPLVAGRSERICVQRVSERMYPAAYPAWFFSRERFLGAFTPSYRVVAEFENTDRANVRADYRGFLFQRT